MIVQNSINSPRTLPGSAENRLPDSLVEYIEELGITTIDGVFIEFKDMYKERIPYVEIPMLDGSCYQWSDIFIEGCLIAMSTDRLVQFSSDELEAWRYFVSFENYHSTSARDTDANGTAIGCTIPDSNNKSYVVAGDGTITNQYCQIPGYEIEGEQIWKSLDNAFMALYNCEEINSCTNSDIPEDIAPCTI